MNILLLVVLILIFFILYQCYKNTNIPNIPNIPYIESFNFNNTYNSPFASNDELNLECHMDTGVMGSYVTNKEVVYTNLWETPIEIMNSIFKDITSKNHKENSQIKSKLFKLSNKNKNELEDTIKITRITYNRLSKIARKILKQINEYQNTKYKTAINKNQKYIFKNLDVVSINMNNIFFNFRIYKPYKQYQYVIHVHLLKETQDIHIKKYIIKEMKIIGLPLEEIIDPVKRETCQQKVNQDQLKGDNLKLIYKDNKVSIENPRINKQYTKYLKNFEKNERNKLFKCFNPHKEFENLPFSLEEECTSYQTCLNDFGVWDKPCTKKTENIDCPFYNKNNKYGCNDVGEPGEGLCKMPEGVSRIGYTHYRSIDKNKESV